MRRALSRLLWSSWGLLARSAGKAYIAGPELDDAIRTTQRLAQLKVHSTICFWNVEADSPQDVADTSRNALVAMKGQPPDCYLSLKLPALQFRTDFLRQITDCAKADSRLLHFDSLSPETADPTYRILRDFATIYPALGCTLPGRWKRSLQDAQTAIELGLHVRVVKGQWVDPQHPDINARDGFLDVIGVLAGRASAVAVATHDPHLARTAVQRLVAAGTRCSLELLFGLPMKPAMTVARELNIPVRVYVPYGYGWLPYSLIQAKRNPRIFWWVLRDMLSGGAIPIRA